MKLSERIRRIITDSNLGGEWREIVSGWADEVAQLERKIALQERVIQRKLEYRAQLEAENEALRLYAEFVIEKDYASEFDEWRDALLTGEDDGER